MGGTFSVSALVCFIGRAGGRLRSLYGVVAGPVEIGREVAYRGFQLCPGPEKQDTGAGVRDVVMGSIRQKGGGRRSTKTVASEGYRTGRTKSGWRSIEGGRRIDQINVDILLLYHERRNFAIRNWNI